MSSAVRGEIEHGRQLDRYESVAEGLHIIDGVEAFPEAFSMLFDGRSFGKLRSWSALAGAGRRC